MQYRDLEEQKFRAMQQLFSQEQRACVVRLVGERRPISMRVPKVEGYHLKPERVKQFMEKQAKKWKFLLPMAKAKTGLQLREDTLSKMVVVPEGEPKTARRRI